MSDAAESLTGVVEPALPGMPDLPTPSAYADARERVEVALAMTKQRLVELRAKRQDINDEIKLLVDEEELLGRMAKITPKKT